MTTAREPMPEAELPAALAAVMAKHPAASFGLGWVASNSGPDGAIWWAELDGQAVNAPSPSGLVSAMRHAGMIA